MSGIIWWLRQIILILLGLFPYTRQWRPWLLSTLGLPLKIIVIFEIVYGLIRFGMGLFPNAWAINSK